MTLGQIRNVVLFGLCLIPGAVWAQTPDQSKPAPAATKNDYSKQDNWICWPGRQDSCTVDLSSTIVAADGKLTPETYTSNPKAPIDCFYVYPTISTEDTPNSDMTLGPEEKRVVLAQFARFGSQCRLYAPLYRQVTIAGLREAITGGVTPEAVNQERMLAYHDVVDAWHYYWDHENHGRGVVLIGHSQGSGVLTQLLREEIDGKPVQSHIISALLLGTNIFVPKGKDVGGTFQHLPLCSSASQIGCIITYVSFRATAPPPPGGRFGQSKDESMTVGCTNPAALGGGSGELHSYLPANAAGSIVGHEGPQEEPSWVTPPVPIKTPFVSVPGMLSAECLSNEHGSYLAISVHADPSDARAHDIAGDLVVNGHVLTGWGLHLIDVNLAMGNLVDIVGQQSKTYLKNPPKN
jgi:hypothetical protein